MKRTELTEYIKSIEPPCAEAAEAARQRQARLAKPPGSLGRLEDISVKMAGITGCEQSSATRQAIVIMSSDNGVCGEGVASAPQTVTRAQTVNFIKRLTGVGALAKYFNIELLVADVGIKEELPAALYAESAHKALHENKIWNRKIRPGTFNLAREAAMNEDEALRAVQTGIEAARTLKEEGFQLIGVGEMGIGNTTTSAAVLSALTGFDAEQTVGRGGGVTDASFARKKRIVDQVCRRYGFHGQQETDAIDILAKVGGFDIAAMAGVFLGAAIYRIPAVIDGYISAVAALAAGRIFEQVKASEGNGEFSVHLTDFLFASHKSFERGYEIAVRELGLTPMFDLGMRLGEGSGCPVAFKIIEAAQAALCGMATFDEAEINDDYLEQIRKSGVF